MLKIEQFVFNIFVENTYLIYDDETKEALILDPGCFDEYELSTLTDFINKNNLKVKYLVNTHCHLDHILGNLKLKKIMPEVPLLYPKEDEFLVDTMPKQLMAFNLEPEESIKADQYISEDLKINLGNIEGTFLFTPGHTPGEYCLYFENEKVLFTGDVLFKENIGRTDLWGGNYDILIESITNKLLVLPDEVNVYPGHGEKTTIGYERRNNLFLNKYH